MAARADLAGSLDREAFLGARTQLDRAIEADPRFAMAHARLAEWHTLRVGQGWSDDVQDEGIRAAAAAWMYSSATLSYLGRGADAVASAEHALRLSPRDQWHFQFSFFRGLAHYAAGDHAAALEWGAASLAENPRYTATPKLLAAANAPLGRDAAAREAVARLLALEPGFVLGDYLRRRQPFRDPALADAYAGHLRRAGVPE